MAVDLQVRTIMVSSHPLALARLPLLPKDICLLLTSEDLAPGASKRLTHYADHT